MYNVCSSDMGSLHFPDKETYKEYKRKEELLHIETYAIIRKKHGIWASNQNKFVKDAKDFNRFDSVLMEDLFRRYQEEDGDENE